MVWLAETSLTPLGALADLEDLVEVYLGDLSKNGQIWGEPLVTPIDGTLHVACIIPCADSLSDEYASDFVHGDLEKVVAAAGEPVWRVRGGASAERTTREAWLQCPSFYMRTHLLDRSSPVVAGDSGEAVPLYLLGIDPNLREALLFWMSAYAALDRIWLNSRALEMPAYLELSGFDSDFNRHGRSIAADVERAVGRPVHYYLMTYFVRHPPSVQESCPSCGAPWRAAESARTRGLEAFAFRCDPCRLVADPGVDTSNLPETEG
jgi:predicted  nucleic acid-binding Zn ribbon protein